MLDVGVRRPSTTERALPDRVQSIIEEALDDLGWTAVAFDRDALIATMIRAYVDGLRRGAQDLQRTLYDLGRVRSPRVSMDFALDNPDALAAIRRRARFLDDAIPEGTRTYMLDSIKSAFSQEGPGSSQALVSAIYENLTSEEQGALSRKRVKSIVDTEMNFLHSSGRMEQFRAAGLKRKRWIAVPSVACRICLANAAKGAVPLDYARFGSVFGSGISHPPAHPRVCVPGDTVVLPGGNIFAVSSRWYYGDMIVIRTAGGNQLTCTPNHPVLTTRGWVAAHLLKEGSYVISGDFSQQMPSVINSDSYEVPTRIEQIANSLSVPSRFIAVEVPTSSEDFHGDGIGSEVAVIYTDYLLRDHRYVSESEHVSEDNLCRTHLQQALLDRTSMFKPLGHRLSPSFPLTRMLASGVSNVSSVGYYESVARPMLKSVKLPFRAIPYFNTSFSKYRPQRGSGYAEPTRDSIERLTGQVVLDKLISVEVITSWKGQVYNLDTEFGFYSSNGIITQNCHCRLDIDRDEIREMAQLAYWSGGDELEEVELRSFSVIVPEIPKREGVQDLTPALEAELEKLLSEYVERHLAGQHNQQAHAGGRGKLAMREGESIFYEKPASEYMRSPTWEAFNQHGSDAYSGGIFGPASKGQSVSARDIELTKAALDSYPPEQIRNAEISTIQFAGNLPAGTSGGFSLVDRSITIRSDQGEHEKLRALHHEIGHAVDIAGTRGTAIGQDNSIKLSESYRDAMRRLNYPGDPPELGYQLWQNGHATHNWQIAMKEGIPTAVTPYALSNRREYAAETIGHYLHGRRMGDSSPLGTDEDGARIMRGVYGPATVARRPFS